MRVAIYARVSTRDKQEVETQLRELRAFIKRHKWTAAGEYIDKMSGASSLSTLEEQNRLFNDASKKEFDRVLVFALSRFIRGSIPDTFKRIERLKASGVDFWSFTEEHFRTSGPAGEWFIATAAFMSELERHQICERVQAGVDRARAEGTVLGRPSKYDAGKIKGMRAGGFSIDEIVAQTGLSRATVYNKLNAPGEAPVANVA